MVEKREKKEEAKHLNEKSLSKTSGDVVEINVGAYLGKIRKNPWIAATFVFAIALIVLIVLLTLNGSSSGTSAVSEKAAVDNLLSFINSQGRGAATLVSAEETGGLYQITVNYAGDNIPVFVTLDGKYLITDRIPLSSQAGQVGDDSNVNTGSGERVEVSIGNSPVLGNKSAQVTIVEFSDYQCPFCRKFWTESYEQIKNNYIDTGKVKLVFKDFPLDFHPGAIPYAEAARCAREKGGDAAYWKIHDKIFEEQNKLDGGSVRSTITYVGDDTLKKWVKELGYDISSCLDSGKYKSDIQVDLAYGQSIGVSGTPGFFINGVKVEGAQPYSAFQQIIDAELAGSN